MISYQLFSLPNCEKCTEVKEFLKSRSISYEEHNLGMTSGKKVWGPILMGGYQPKKDEHGYIMPILVKKKDSNIEAIVQGIEDVKVLLA